MPREVSAATIERLRQLMLDDRGDPVCRRPWNSDCRIRQQVARCQSCISAASSSSRNTSAPHTQRTGFAYSSSASIVMQRSLKARNRTRMHTRGANENTLKNHAPADRRYSGIRTMWRSSGSVRRYPSRRYSSARSIASRWKLTTRRWQHEHLQNRQAPVR